MAAPEILARPDDGDRRSAVAVATMDVDSVVDIGWWPSVGSAHAFVSPAKRRSEVTDRQVHERVRAVVEPALREHGFELVDVERAGPVLRVTVDLLVGPGDQVDLLVGPGDQVDRPAGLDMEGVTQATRLVNELLDTHDLIGDTTSLEVSSPGLERPLRTPEHFRRFVGAEVAVKAKAGVEGERRLSGTLDAADDEGVVVAGRRLAYADIERARTVFVWPAPAQPKKKMGRAS
jgi:ribosome maturation factor RimP